MSGLHWLRKAFLVSILNHPDVRESNVYYPSTDPNLAPERITIERARLFGGIELIEPGLTLSVHPYHSGFDVKRGVAQNEVRTIDYSFAKRKQGYETIGNTQYDKCYYACIRLFVQLFYRDPSLNIPTILKSEFIRENPAIQKYHGFNENFVQGHHRDDVLREDTEGIYGIPEEFSIEVQTLPGEEILTLWMDIIKNVIRDIKFLRPYRQYRNPVILQSDYPTTSWLANSPNLVFHTAFHVVEFDVAEPSREFPYEVPNINTIKIDAPP